MARLGARETKMAERLRMGPARRFPEAYVERNIAPGGEGLFPSQR